MRAYLLLMFFSLGITILLTPVVRRFALTFRVLTPLRARDVHVVPTPSMGGVAITGGFLAALLVGRQIPYFQHVFSGTVIWAIALGTIAICILGIIDDIWELDWMAKLGGQLLIAALMAVGGVQLISFPVFGLTIGSSRLSIIVSVLVMVTIVNAVNFIDGLDGLAAGVIAIGAASFFLYSYLLTRLGGEQTYATASAIVMIALVGGCLGFLWYNFHPASIFMGDSGAMVLGLLMGSAAITVTGQINPSQLGDRMGVASVLPLLLPLVVVFIPLADLVLTALRRMVRGKSPFTADRTHLHDQLLDRGHSHRGVVVILYGWTALACGVGISLLLFRPVVVLIVGGVALVLLVLLTRFFIPGLGNRLQKRHKGGGVPGGTVLQDDGILVISRAQARHEAADERPLGEYRRWQKVQTDSPPPQAKER